MGKTSTVKAVDKGFLQASEVEVLETTVTSIEDAMRRMTVYYILCSFLQELPFEVGLSVKRKFDIWNERVKPSLKSILVAFHTAGLEVERLCKDERDVCPTFESAVVHVRDNKLESMYFTEAVMAGGTRALHPEPFVGSAYMELPDGVMPRGVVAVDGHFQPNMQSTGPLFGKGEAASRGLDATIINQKGGRKGGGKRSLQGGPGPEVQLPIVKQPGYTAPTTGVAQKNKLRKARAKAKAAARTSQEHGLQNMTWLNNGQEVKGAKKGALGKGKEKGNGKGKKGDKNNGKAVPAEQMAWFNSNADWKGRCMFWNSSVGCARGDQCSFLHESFVDGSTTVPAAAGHAVGTPFQN